jgi:hypothetical protein
VIAVLFKIDLTTKSDREAAVIGSEAYSSDHRGGRGLIAGADRKNVGQYRHDSRTQGWAGDWKRCGNKRPAIPVPLLLRFALLNSGL